MSSNNNLNHISDLSQYKIFDPSGTQWDSSINNVQSALSLIGSWAMTSHGLPVSSTSTSGILKIASQDQVNAGTDNTTAVTPATLAVRIQHPSATTTVAGLTRYATDSEALAGSVTDAAIVPETLNYVFNNKAASETASGTIKLTTDSQAKAGTDDTTAATPMRVKQMIALFSPTQISYQPAANSVLGVVNIATSQQVAAGTLDTGYAISPKALMGTKASQSQYGVIRTATNAEVITGSDSTIAVSPASLSNLTATSNRTGLVQIATSYANDSISAAAASSVVFNTRKVNGHQLNNDITISSSDVGTYDSGTIDSKLQNQLNTTNNSISNLHDFFVNSLINLGDLYSIAYMANKSNTTLNPGDTIDGSNLSYAGIGADWTTTGNSKDYAVVAASWGPQGTWKCLGYCPGRWSDGGFTTLFIRIA